MENQKSSAKSIMLNYGLMLAFASILISVANYAVGDVYKPHWSISIISILLTIAVIVIGIKKFKEGNEGFLKLGQALKIGLGVAVISGILLAIYMFVFTTYIEPDFYSNMTKIQEVTMMEKFPNMSDEELIAAKEMSSTFTGPGMTAAFSIAGSLFFGFIISLIAGLIMKNNPVIED